MNHIHDSQGEIRRRTPNIPLFQMKDIMAHYTPRGQIIEHLRKQLRDAENQIDDMYRQKKRMVHEMAEDKKTL